MLNETIGQQEEGIHIFCPSCLKQFHSGHGLREHERHKRCHVAYPRAKRKRADQMRDQTVGSYTDPWKGHISLSRGEDGYFGCPHCGKRITRIDKVRDHARYHCKADKGRLVSRATQQSRVISMNKGLHSMPSSTTVEPDSVEVTCVV